MEYLALYRKYRPLTFDKLIGQDSIVKTLTNQIKTGRIGHAYLFTGSRGTGKTSCAKIFARAVNCTNSTDGSPCGKCESCLALSDPSNIDVIEIDAASNNGVNEIRDLREKVQYPPVSCKYKVYIIDEVHMLTGPAFNALLKTLEEPPKHAIFILATTEVHKIPATILSRCMRFDFRLIPTEKIASLISSIYDEIGKKYDKEAVYQIAKAGEGSIRDALSIADTALSFSTEKLTYDDVTSILGSTNFELICDFITAIIGSDTGKVLTYIDSLSKLGKSVGVLVKDVTEFIRNLLVIKTCSSPNEILCLPMDKFDTLKNIADSTNQARLLRILEIFSEIEASLRYSNHPRVILETASIKASRNDCDFNYDALLARINDLEQKLNEGVKVVVNNNIAENNTANKVLPSDLNQNKTVLKKSLVDSGDLVLGELLTNLRKNGHEMLWNLLNGIDIKVLGNILVLTTSSKGDVEILDRNDNKGYIEEALSDYLPFEIQVKLSDDEKKSNQIEDESEKIKQIFGNDIVIIKD